MSISPSEAGGLACPDDKDDDDDDDTVFCGASVAFAFPAAAALV
jgi:hypothetical protein